jgi:uncharacterized membrane protein YphA (DoxX/SURF4 family)
MKKWLPIVARVLLGLVFAASGIFAFASGFATPPDLPAKLQAFNAGLAASVYFMPFLKAVEIVCGLMLITGLWVPLALVVLAPVLVNILLVHAFLAPEGIVIGAVLAALAAYLSFFVSPYREKILPLFRR